MFVQGFNDPSQDDVYTPLPYVGDNYQARFGDYGDFGRFRIGRVVRSIVKAPIQAVKKVVSAVPIIGKPIVKATSAVLTPIAKVAGKNFKNLISTGICRAVLTTMVMIST